MKKIRMDIWGIIFFGLLVGFIYGIGDGIGKGIFFGFFGAAGAASVAIGMRRKSDDVHARVGLRVYMSTRTDKVIDSACEVIKIMQAEKISNLYLSFFEGRGAVGAEFIAGPRIKENSSLAHWFTFTIRGDHGGADHHRDPVRYARMLRKIERLAPELVVRGWWLTGLKGIVRAIWDVHKERRRILRYEDLSHPAVQGWLKNCQNLPSGLIRKYITITTR